MFCVCVCLGLPGQVLADTTRHLNPTVLTVFSAPNYCDRYRNKAAVLHIERPGYYTVNLLGKDKDGLGLAGRAPAQILVGL